MTKIKMSRPPDFAGVPGSVLYRGRLKIVRSSTGDRQDRPNTRLVKYSQIVGCSNNKWQRHTAPAVMPPLLQVVVEFTCTYRSLRCNRFLDLEAKSFES